MRNNARAQTHARTAMVAPATPRKSKAGGDVVVDDAEATAIALAMADAVMAKAKAQATAHVTGIEVPVAPAAVVVAPKAKAAPRPVRPHSAGPHFGFRLDQAAPRAPKPAASSPATPRGAPRTASASVAQRRAAAQQRLRVHEAENLRREVTSLREALASKTQALAASEAALAESRRMSGAELGEMRRRLTAADRAALSHRRQAAQWAEQRAQIERAAQAKLARAQREKVELLRCLAEASSCLAHAHAPPQPEAPWAAEADAEGERAEDGGGPALWMWAPALPRGRDGWRALSFDPEAADADPRPGPTSNDLRLGRGLEGPPPSSRGRAHSEPNANSTTTTSNGKVRVRPRSAQPQRPPWGGVGRRRARPWSARDATAGQPTQHAHKAKKEPRGPFEGPGRGLAALAVVGACAKRAVDANERLKKEGRQWAARVAAMEEAQRGAGMRGEAANATAEEVVALCASLLQAAGLTCVPPDVPTFPSPGVGEAACLEKLWHARWCLGRLVDEVDAIKTRKDVLETDAVELSFYQRLHARLVHTAAKGVAAREGDEGDGDGKKETNASALSHTPSKTPPRRTQGGRHALQAIAVRQEQRLRNATKMTT